LGAGRVVAAGRSEHVLSTLHGLGADSTIRLDKPDEELIAAFRREAGEKRFDVIIDYLWGRRLDWWRWAKALDLQSLCLRQSCEARR
jgi:NADPH:quinone reductase-like Zn-dependent oxidoreductase